jgi:homoserine O-acetyltransferase
MITSEAGAYGCPSVRGLQGGAELGMKHIIALASIALSASGAFAQNAPTAYPDQKESDFIVSDFRFTSGETLKELRLHYATLGSPQRNGAGEITNAVLLLHGTSGTGKNYLRPMLGGELFGKGQPLDATKYYVILPDNIGRGGSSKPSDGMRAKFPHYRYSDVVEAQHRLVTEALGVKHLRLVLGTSMGAMNTWMWGERYPQMMDALVPIASQPIEVSGRNWLFRRMTIDAIRNDPDWSNGDYEKQPTRWVYADIVGLLMTANPSRLQEAAPTRAKADALYEQWLADEKKLDTNDELYAIESILDYDPAPALEKIQAKLLAVNFADDEVNPAEIGTVQREITRVKNAKLVIIPTTEMSYGHTTTGRAAIWKPYLAEFLSELP